MSRGLRFLLSNSRLLITFTKGGRCSRRFASFKASLESRSALLYELASPSLVLWW